jgi:hypothetical protein
MTTPTYYIVAPGIAMAFWNDGDVVMEAPLKSDGTPDMEKTEEIPGSHITALHIETGISMLEDYIEKRINGDI